MDERHLSHPKEWPDKYGDYLFRNALLRTQDPGIAEDLVQETFLAALQARHRYAGEATEKTWLMAILKHKIMDYFRKRSRETPVEPESAPGHDLDNGEGFDTLGYWKSSSVGPRAWTSTPGMVLERKEFWDALQHCLRSLPPREAAVFSLREFDGIASPEICDILNISSANLWVLLHRARKHLRQCLESQYFQQDTR